VVLLELLVGVNDENIAYDVLRNVRENSLKLVTARLAFAILMQKES